MIRERAGSGYVVSWMASLFKIMPSGSQQGMKGSLEILYRSFRIQAPGGMEKRNLFLPEIMMV
jgi:hypothetical protein